MELARESLNGKDLVFVDEMGITLDVSSSSGRTHKGERVEEGKPVNTPPNTAVMGALGMWKDLLMGRLSMPLWKRC